MKPTLKDEIKKISPEFIKELNKFIHDWRGFRLIMNTCSKNEDNSEYDGEFNWNKKAKVYWDEKQSILRSHIENIDKLLYSKLE